MLFFQPFTLHRELVALGYPDNDPGPRAAIASGASVASAVMQRLVFAWLCIGPAATALAWALERLVSEGHDRALWMAWTLPTSWALGVAVLFTGRYGALGATVLGAGVPTLAYGVTLVIRALLPGASTFVVFGGALLGAFSFAHTAALGLAGRPQGEATRQTAILSASVAIATALSKGLDGDVFTAALVGGVGLAAGVLGSLRPPE
jgi:hypothetical protein